MKELITQPDFVPTRKVGMGQFAASIVTIAAWGVEEFTALAIPLFIGTAFLQAVMFAVQYWIKDSA